MRDQGNELTGMLARGLALERRARSVKEGEKDRRNEKRISHEKGRKQEEKEEREEEEIQPWRDAIISRIGAIRFVGCFRAIRVQPIGAAPVSSVQTPRAIPATRGPRALRDFDVKPHAPSPDIETCHETSPQI
jgi:hypothetical protein